MPDNPAAFAKSTPDPVTQPVILLTRPRGASERFAEALRAALSPVRIAIAPLIEIRPITRHIDLEDTSALIFTSAAGVSVFGELTDVRDLPAWCVGNRTAEAAREIGLQAHAAGGDAEALIGVMVEARPMGRLLHLHGAHVRGDVVARLCEAGLRAEGQAIYDQQAVPPDETFRAALSGATIVPLFSPRTAALFAEAARDVPTGAITVVALSPAVAEALPEWLRAEVVVATRPDASAMLRAVSAAISA